VLLPSLDTVSGAEVDLRGVGFSHGPHPVLADVTVTVGPRNRLAVVGPNGVGKSTLLALMTPTPLPSSAG
jgi:ATPase subunit of ABC transporter with duplicated ATPase domains